VLETGAPQPQQVAVAVQAEAENQLLLTRMEGVVSRLRNESQSRGDVDDRIVEDLVRIQSELASRQTEGLSLSAAQQRAAKVLVGSLSDTVTSWSKDGTRSRIGCSHQGCPNTATVQDPDERSEKSGTEIQPRCQSHRERLVHAGHFEGSMDFVEEGGG
jgi:hypothetical protein